MTMLAREVTLPSPRQASLTTTQEKYLANAVLKAIRRGPSRHTEGTEDRLTFIGISSIPNGPRPHVLDERWIAISEPHVGLDLPQINLYLPGWLMDDAKDLCYAEEWAHLHRVAKDTNIQLLYHVRQNSRGYWYAERNPDAHHAPTAARTIVGLARALNDPTRDERHFIRVGPT